MPVATSPPRPPAPSRELPLPPLPALWNDLPPDARVQVARLFARLLRRLRSQPTPRDPDDEQP